MTSFAATLPMVALTGQPNTGKSTIFNALTGLSQQVSNWPGRTVAHKSGTADLGPTAVTLVDLPGNYGLTPASEEERVTRDFLLHDSPAVLVLVASAAAPERSLVHALDAALLGRPVVLAMNMMDVAEREGRVVDTEVLTRRLGIPVVAMNAAQGVGLDPLRRAVAAALSSRNGASGPQPSLPDDLLEIWAALRERLTAVPALQPSQSFLALKLLEHDPDVRALLQRALPEREFEELDRLIRSAPGARERAMEARHAQARKLTAASLSISGPDAPVFGRFDSLATHPLTGPLLAVAVLIAALVCGFLVGFPLPILIMKAMFATEEAAHQALLPFAPWLAGMAQGVVRGVGSVLCLLPFLMTFYAVFAVLEDVGYLARVAYVMDGLMSRIGLSGKAFVVLLFSLPCNVPGVAAGRICDSEQQRLLSMLLAPLVPCSAKIAVAATLAVWLFPPWIAALAVPAVLAINILVLGAASTTLNHLLFAGTPPRHMILELPRYQRPNWRAVAAHAVAKGRSFVRKAGTLIVCFSVVVWFIAYFPTGEVRTSLLGRAGMLLEPLGAYLGLDWRLITALFASLLNKEALLATMAIIYDTPLSELPTMLRAELSPASAFSFMVAQSLFLPCVATLGVLGEETGKIAWGPILAAGTALLALAASFAAYQLANLLL